jgi:hypothetical protein
MGIHTRFLRRHCTGEARSLQCVREFGAGALTHEIVYLGIEFGVAEAVHPHGKDSL